MGVSLERWNVHIGVSWECRNDIVPSNFGTFITVVLMSTGGSTDGKAEL